MSTDPRDALLLLGCPGVPVQQALALYLLGRLRADGFELECAGNPAVLQLLRVRQVHDRCPIDRDQRLRRRGGPPVHEAMLWDVPARIEDASEAARLEPRLSNPDRRAVRRGEG